MKKYFNVLKQCPLFQSINDENLLSMLDCLGARVASYKKKETILAEGSPAKYIGIMLAGSAQIIQYDYFGNRSLVSEVEPSELFAESFACADVGEVPVNIVASEDCRVMFVECIRVMQTCSCACECHRQMIYNLIRDVAIKNIMFHQRMEITSKRTTREKLMTYLTLQAKKNKEKQFDIPYDRQELADYLEVDRSGLSAEISKLRREGVLKSEKNHFELL